MCIDLVAGGKSKNTKRTSPRSEDTYLKLTVKLYDFIRQMTKCHFSKVIRHRLCMSKVNKAPLLLSRLIRYMQGKEDKIVVLVGTVIGFKTASKLLWVLCHGYGAVKLIQLIFRIFHLVLPLGKDV